MWPPSSPTLFVYDLLIHSFLAFYLMSLLGDFLCVATAGSNIHRFALILCHNLNEDLVFLHGGFAWSVTYCSYGLNKTFFFFAFAIG